MQNNHFSVLGAGLMGVGIATHFARFGHNIWLFDTIATGLLKLTPLPGAFSMS